MALVCFCFVIRDTYIAILNGRSGQGAKVVIGFDYDAPFIMRPSRHMIRASKMKRQKGVWRGNNMPLLDLSS